MILSQKKNKTVDSRFYIEEILVLFYLVIFQINGFCTQNNDVANHHKIAVNTGYYSLSSIDELYSSQKYSGGNVFIGASYNYQTAKYIHSLSLDFTRVQRKPDHISISDNLYISEGRYKEVHSILVNLDYSVMRKIYAKYLDFYVTGSLLNSVNDNRDASLEVYYSSLAAGLFLNYRNHRHTIGFNISVPLISLVSREEYHISSAQNVVEKRGLEFVFSHADFKPFGNIYILYTGFSYAYSISKNIELSAMYNFRYLYDKAPRPLKSVSGIYSLCTMYKF